MDGHWKYEANASDPVYGEPESLNMVLRTNGSTVCGSLMSAWRGGMKVDERRFSGELHGGTARVQYEEDGESGSRRGTAELRWNGAALAWRVVVPAGEGDYVVRRARLHRSQPLLEEPKECVK
jgi:hypothetical protein